MAPAAGVGAGAKAASVPPNLSIADETFLHLWKYHRWRIVWTPENIAAAKRLGLARPPQPYRNPFAPLRMR
jgi:hypothetical protein